VHTHTYTHNHTHIHTHMHRGTSGQLSTLGIGSAHGSTDGLVDMASMSHEAAADFDALQTQYCNLLLQFWNVEVQLK